LQFDSIQEELSIPLLDKLSSWRYYKYSFYTAHGLISLIALSFSFSLFRLMNIQFVNFFHGKTTHERFSRARLNKATEEAAQAQHLSEGAFLAQAALGITDTRDNDSA
jgi:hypothetical protein